MRKHGSAGLPQRLGEAIRFRQTTAYKVDQKCKARREWSIGYVTKIIREDQRGTPIDRVESIALALDISPCWLAFGIGDMVPQVRAIDPLDVAIAWRGGRYAEDTVRRVREWAVNHPKQLNPTEWDRILREVQQLLTDDVEVDEQALEQIVSAKPANTA